MESMLRVAGCIGLLLAGMLLYGCGGGGSGGGDGGDGNSSPTYTLSGTLQSAVGNAVDGDVNDPYAPYNPNNTITTAQPIPSTVILGGYANQPGAGSSGRSYNRGDLDDWYRVTLQAGQTLTLSIAGDGLFNDLDLELYNAANQLVDASRGTEKFESLTVSQTGDYFIRVRVYDGASNYNLAIAQPPSAGNSIAEAFTPPSGAPAGCMRLSDAFMPDEIIVRFADAAGAVAPGLQARAQALGLKAKAGAEGRSMLFSLADLDRNSLYQTLGIAAADKSVADPDSVADPRLQRKQDTLLAVKAMRKRSDVLYAEPNCLRYASFAPNDPFYDPQQWHYPLIDLPQAWDLNQGTGVIVAVVDTGVVLKHPDLQGQFVQGYDFISDADNAADGDGIDPNPDDPGDRIDPSQPSSFHGTHVAGIIAALTNNSIGVAGVAFKARIMPLRALGRFGGSIYDIQQAIRYAAGLDNDSDSKPQRRADVINLSLGGASSSAADQDVYQQVRDAGVTIIAAAGNNSSALPSYPAAYDGVIAVSAVTITKALAYYSNYGSYVDVAAPGGDTRFDINGDGQPDGVLSTAATQSSNGGIQPGYLSYQGTSMASPHMAGVVALMLSANPALTPSDIDNLLAGGKLSSDLGQPGRDDSFGYGLIDAYRAVVAALDAAGKPVTPIPIISVNPAGLNFGLFIDRITVNVSNGGGGDLRIDSVTTDADGWLTITPQADSNGLGDYIVSVNRTDLSDGTYTAKIIFGSQNANSTVQVPVIMQVSALDFTNVGILYVLLIDPRTGAVVDSAAAAAQSNGVYRYSLTKAPPGTYKIMATTDCNYNRAVCDAGEACGAYKTLDQPINIVVDGDRGDLNFAVGFSAGIKSEASASSSESPPGSGSDSIQN